MRDTFKEKVPTSVEYLTHGTFAAQAHQNQKFLKNKNRRSLHIMIIWLR